MPAADGGEGLPARLAWSPFLWWRGGRVVEGAALEMLYRGNSIEGSNPSLSVDIQPRQGLFYSHRFVHPGKGGKRDARESRGEDSAEATADVIEGGLLAGGVENLFGFAVTRTACCMLWVTMIIV